MKTIEKEKASQHASERQEQFTTVSGEVIKHLYTPEDLSGLDYERDLGDPGEFPYTRGAHPTMYRGKLWTMRQFSGYGTPQATNRRFKFLLEQGQTGLSVAFDLPTLMGVDSDGPLAEGEVGKCGVAVDSLEDMEILFHGIPLDQVTTSMTINAPAAVLLAMYVVVAEKQGVDPAEISGTVQNDILKEFIAQKEWIYPPEPSMRLVVDSIQFCTEHLPRYNSISISGYHIREAGSTALQELAFTLRDGIEYVQWCRRAGMAVDDFAPRLSFFFNSHNDFFEEIAKFRAARRLWAYVMRDHFGAKSERSWMCRFHTQTAGCSLTAQQPLNNIVRSAIQALAAVLGGTNSLHTNSLDEALALPTEEAARIALRTQQILAYESGVPNTVDPLGGSYFVEALTNEMEEGARQYFHKIDAMGGMIGAIERGFPQREIQEASYQYQKAVEKRQKIIVGVNQFVVDNEPPIEVLQIGPEVQEHQVKRLKRLRSRRNNQALQKALSELEEAARSDKNLMPFLIEAVKEYATLGEMCDALKEVFGIYQEPAF
ncbi:methylmalonyl-CoA mutase family protein [Acidobacteria bacterium AH-259-L09]|nr:methylmalonyl-CoA mutase family protein [Acidobacteria bacterium AH-259-L09]